MPDGGPVETISQCLFYLLAREYLSGREKKRKVSGLDDWNNYFEVKCVGCILHRCVYSAFPFPLFDILNSSSFGPLEEVKDYLAKIKMSGLYLQNGDM